MKTINRTVITIVPKKPFIDWANSFDDGGPKLAYDSTQATSILIPDDYDEYNYEEFMKMMCQSIFEEELSSWMDNPDEWPKKRDYKTFKEWFELIVSDTVIDYGENIIIRQDY